MTDVLVLNADMEPLQRVSLRHAIRMLVRMVAEVHEAEPDRQLGVFPMPTAVRLIAYVFPKWQHAKGPAWSKRAVLRRDGHVCGYCGRRGDTVDHIVPQSRGGRNTWTNTVAACDRCNQRKANRTPAEAGMVLRTPPTAPSWSTWTR